MNPLTISSIRVFGETDGICSFKLLPEYFKPVFQLMIIKWFSSSKSMCFLILFKLDLDTPGEVFVNLDARNQNFIDLRKNFE